MATRTAVWQIPYPESTDRFCDGDFYIQEMAEKVDSIMDGFDFDLARTEVVPTSRVSLSATTTLPVAGTVEFDQVDWDNSSMVNLAINPTDISSTDAAFIFGAAAQFYNTSSNVATNDYTIVPNNTSATPEFMQRVSAVPGSAILPGNGSSEAFFNGQADVNVTLSFDGGSSAAGVASIALYTYMWVHWFSDNIS
jgi:hypothetical protein